MKDTRYSDKPGSFIPIHMYLESVSSKLQSTGNYCLLKKLSCKYTPNFRMLFCIKTELLSPSVLAIIGRGLHTAVART